MWYIFRRRRVRYGILFALGMAAFLLLGFRDTIIAHKWQIAAAIPGPIRRAGRITWRGLNDLPYLRYRFASHDLPVYDLRIKPDDLAFLNGNLPDSEGFISEAGDKYKQTVPAELVYDGQTYRVDVRYRGEKKTHWLWPKKSWRINFDKDNLFDGQRQLNLIIPLDRQYLAEQFNNYRAKKLGLVVPGSRFAVLRVNGRNPAIYWEVENFTKEFVEKAGLSSDTHIYGEVGILQPIYRDIKYWQTYLGKTTGADDDFAPLSRLIDLINSPDRALFQQQIFSIVDKKSFYAWNIHALLSATSRMDWAQNIRLYWNPALGKFQFFPWDTGVGSGWIESDPLVIDQGSNPLINRVLSYPEFLSERNSRLWEYLKDSNQIKDDLVVYDELFAQTRVAFYQDRIRRFNNRYFDNEVNRLRGVIERQFFNLRDLFTNADAHAVLRQTDADLELEVAFSRTAAPVYIDSIEFDFIDGAPAAGFDVLINGRRICASTGAPPNGDGRQVTAQCERFELMPRFEYAKLVVEEVPEGEDYQVIRLGEAKHMLNIQPHGNIDVADIEKIKVVLKNGFTGDRISDVNEQIADTRRLDSTLAAKTPREFAAAHSSFQVNDNELVLPAGIYTFDSDVVVPKDTRLTISPGTVINLIRGASLVSYSPIIARGALDAMIIVRGDSSGRGGNTVILDNEGTSFFEYAHFSGAGEGRVNGVFFSGMLALHHANGIIRYSVFENARGDDALNIKYASSTVAGNTFRNNAADAIDYDLSAGVIDGNVFVGNGNDAIDTSGSAVSIQNNAVWSSGDKCISVGENSTPVIFNNVLTGCRTGIEVKDLSRPIIINSVITKNFTGISSYQKKPFFGGGRGRVVNSIIWDNATTTAADTVSTLEITHSAVDGGYPGEGNFTSAPVFSNPLGRDFTINFRDADELYRQGDRAVLEDAGILLEAPPVGLAFPVTL